jgi:hypothetical protein
LLTHPAGFNKILAFSEFEFWLCVDFFALLLLPFVCVDWEDDSVEVAEVAPVAVAAAAAAVLDDFADVCGRLVASVVETIYILFYICQICQKIKMIFFCCGGIYGFFQNKM